VTSAALAMTKHHAAGNDFLVLIDLDDSRSLSPDEVRALCDRRRGVGADGILRVLRGRDGAQLQMDLRNADGGSAEMSGNGIRCLVQAAVDSRLVTGDAVSVGTPAGVRDVDYEPPDGATAHATVGMGQLVLGAECHPEGVERLVRSRRVDVGNPHLVLWCEQVRDEDVLDVGGRLSHSVPGGINVEFVTEAASGSSIHLRVHERGVGETLACGTGACAAAAAMHSWGKVGREVEVVMAGGLLQVRLSDSEAFLRGPTSKVADVTVFEQDLTRLVEQRRHLEVGWETGVAAVGRA
jgi:diaminopimelate epimerase